MPDIRVQLYQGAQMSHPRDPYDGAIMARSRPLTWHYLTYFDGCGFGKYWVISFRLALLMPLAPSHNLLVRGSNPCGGTNYLARVLTFTSRELWCGFEHQSFLH
jgi:hypothetical protein